MEAVGEIDLVDGPIRAGAGVGEGVGNGGDGEHPAALCDEIAVGQGRSRVEDSHSLHLLRRLDGPDGSAADRSSWIPPRRHDHGHRMLGRESRRSDLRQPAGRDGVEQLGEVAFDQGHDRLALGVAEADVILDQLGPRVGEHQPGIEHSAERRPGGGHRARGGAHDLVHRPSFELRREHGSGGIGAHPAGVRTGIALAHALVILGRGERDGGLAVDEGKQARFLDVQEFLDDQRSVARGADRRLGFFPAHRHGDALAGGEAVGLDHHRDAEAVERRQSIRRAVNPHIVSSRDAVGAAQVLGEALGAFELRGRRAGAEHRDRRGAQGVRYAGDQRRFGADDHETDPIALRQLDHCGGIARVCGDAFGPPRDPRIARGRDQPVAAWRLPKPPRERIFASARPQQQYVHGSP